MEKITVRMIKKKHYSEDKDIRRLLKYISGKGKNRDKEHAYVGANGLRCDEGVAAEQIIRMQEFLGKASKRRAYQMIVSFPKGTKIVNVIAASKCIGEMLFWEKGFQSYYGIHTSTGHLHIHYCINATSYITGKKWHKSQREFEVFKQEVRELAEKCIG